MPSRRFRQILRGGVTVGATAGLVFTLAISQARAGDDGAAPIWEGIGSVFGPYLGFEKDKDPMIDYRDRGRLVLPPKIALPPPSATAGIGNVDWPVDPDVQSQKKAKQEIEDAQQQGTFRTLYAASRHARQQSDDDRDGGTGRGRSAAVSQGRRAGLVFAAKPAPQIRPPHLQLESTDLGRIGEERRYRAGAEPDRQELTDPPKGLRAPVEGPGVKIEN